MKHFMTLLALVVAVTAGAQGTSIHEYPWNPDFNNDTYIGSDDLMGLLSTYGTQFGLPPEPCDYEGTPLEELAAGLLTGTIVLDSVFVEFELEDIGTYYLIGCPDPVTDTVIFAYASMIQGGSGTLNANRYSFYGYDNEGLPNYIQFEVNVQTNTYDFSAQIQKLASNGFIADGFFGGWSHSSGWLSAQLPFPSSWFFDAMGIHVTGWAEDQWPYYANYLHILPYWHYAE
jgi:hypothetical protein